MEYQEDESYLSHSELTSDEQEAILKLNAVSKFKKGDILLKEGETITKSFFVLKGCVRQYHLKDGEEKTTFFYLDDQAIFPNVNSQRVQISQHNLECVEDCSLAVTTLEQEVNLMKSFPRLGDMCRVATEKQFGDYQEMFAKYISSTPEERYLDIVENRSDLLNRVPQYQLASYLGVKPESLSRIRKRLTTKSKKPSNS